MKVSNTPLYTCFDGWSSTNIADVREHLFFTRICASGKLSRVLGRRAYEQLEPLRYPKDIATQDMQIRAIECELSMTEGLDLMRIITMAAADLNELDKIESETLK